MPPSNTRVQRAGELLRAAASGTAHEVDQRALDEARATLEQFRRRFLRPHLSMR
jgi:hypothetical protein